jgi:excisionase family DNA binding protein
MLGVCTATIYRLCERGELAHTRVGAALRIAPGDVARYLDSRRGR